MKCGIDVYSSLAERIDSGARIGLLSHQAAISADGRTSAQVLRQLLGPRLVALFGPEHGFFGQAGPGVKTSFRRHPDWKIPVYSLYGSVRRPTPAMLRKIDTLIVDFSDLGVRCYTYFGTLLYALQACAEAGVRVIVLDRPIPAYPVDGPMLEPGLESFVAPAAVPMVYAMTPGESALWLDGAVGIGAELEVVKMKGWRRDRYPASDFIPPSPGIKSTESAAVYAATVFTEALPAVDCGRDGALAFRLLGAPWMNGIDVCAALDRLRHPGVSFSPHRYTPGGGRYAGQELHGIRISVTDIGKFKPVGTSISILSVLGALYGKSRLWEAEGSRPEWFDKLYGNRQTRQELMDGVAPDAICRGWSRVKFTPKRLY